MPWHVFAPERCGLIRNVIVTVDASVWITGATGVPCRPPLQSVLVTMAVKPLESGDRCRWGASAHAARSSLGEELQAVKETAAASTAIQGAQPLHVGTSR